ncbi:c-type cytochrome [Acidiphilium sp. AL]|uniref:C-type cytochrome n=2 Tax=Acidiphilium iwatense TaxID=768198 RepID=A0ABS9DY23_9PROT|nr:c-type cytochrome [Acidiphilium sp. AL]MCF3947574.1 c-type cytochrome [Acidiphilium iwatense]MCU4160809.1 c-type cytochrome [Acidiphilium sp. AL]
MNGRDANLKKYERRWFVIAMAALGVLLGLSIWWMMSAPGRFPTTPLTDPVRKILRSPMFRHPGVTKLGPHHYRVAVVAHQFQFEPSKIVVPVNARIDFYVTSADVIHGFEIPGTDVNIEVIPGYVAHVFATYHKPHDYLVVCDQYCGIGHQNMIGAFDVVAKMPLPSVQVVPSGPATPAMLAQAGQALYASRCAACHQANGQGLPGAFPPLAKSVPEYESDPRHRTLLADVLLYGLKGKVKAEGKSYNGVMPAWGDQLSNTQIAAILDYIGTAWGNKEAEPAGYKPYDAAAVASARKQTMTSAAVGQLRAKLFAGHTQKH